MPTRPEPDSLDAATGKGGDWESHVRKLFPPPKTPVEELPPVRGVKLGHFEIEERIGRGGMGSVFRALDTRLDRIVALKVLSPDQLKEPASIQRFQNEARLAARLDHENIARVYFVGEERGAHFIAFEYVHGVTVRELIDRRGALTADEAVNFTFQTAEALRQTSAAGMVHRDIKPSNLIVTPSGRVKLVDLGLARTLDPDADQELTVTGTTLGTFDYISPEQARDPRSVDVRSDIYSLGCTLFHMLTGSAPYAGATTVEKLVQHSTGSAPDPAERNPRIPPALSLLVQRMMESNPEQRFQTPEEVIDVLTKISEDLGLRAIAPEGAIWGRALYSGRVPRWSDHKGWLIALAAIVFLAVAGGDIYNWLEKLRGSRAATPAAKPEQPAGRRGAGQPAPPKLVETETPEDGAAAGAASVNRPTAHPPEAIESADPPAPSRTAATTPSSSSASPEVPPPATVSSAPAASLFVVTGPDGTAAGRFPTLEAACTAAESGSVIDIDADGPLPRPQRPILIQNKRLTIRPSIGKRPALSFSAGDEALRSGDLRLIELNGGSLELLNLDLLVNVTPEVAAERWVFVSLSRTVGLTMRGTTLTVANPEAASAVMLERRPEEAGFSLMGSTEAPQAGVILCEDCLFRGGAAFFTDRAREAGTLRLSEVGIAVGDSVLRVEGEMPSEFDSARGAETFQVLLDHVTAVTKQSFLQVETGEMRAFAPLRIECRNSIVDTLSSISPLVLLAGHQHSDWLLEQVKWTGDHSVFATDARQACVVQGADDEWQYSLGQWTQGQPAWDLSSDVVTTQRVIALGRELDLSQGEIERDDFALRAGSAIAVPTDRSDPGYRPAASTLPDVLPRPVAMRRTSFADRRTTTKA